MSCFNRYTKKPPAANKAARIAWNIIESGVANGRKIETLWYAPEMNAWAVQFDDGEYGEVDEITVGAIKNNPDKFGPAPAYEHKNTH